MNLLKDCYVSEVSYEYPFSGVDAIFDKDESYKIPKTLEERENDLDMAWLTEDIGKRVRLVGLPRRTPDNDLYLRATDDDSRYLDWLESREPQNHRAYKQMEVKRDWKRWKRTLSADQSEARTFLRGGIDDLRILDPETQRRINSFKKKIYG